MYAFLGGIMIGIRCDTMLARELIIILLDG